MPVVSRSIEEPARATSPGHGWRSWLKRSLRLFVGDYEIWRIYRCDLASHQAADISEFHDKGYDFREVSGEEIGASAHEEIRSRAFYAGDGAHTFAVYHGGDIVCLECFWFGERYRQRNFWPLEDGEAKAVEIHTVPGYRGKGLATALKAYTDAWFKDRGFRHLYSRVWYTNQSSCRMSEKAGWKNIAIVAEFTPFCLKWKVRLVHRL